VGEQLLPATKQTITTIIGISTILAATIIGETGSITRFRSPAAFAVYNGTAPARNSTGGRDRHKARRDCNHRLKRAFYLAARAAVLHDPSSDT
jgi:transposase